MQTPNNHTQAGDQNFHNKVPPQWLKSLQALLWAFQSSFHRSLSPLWDYKTDNFFGCNGTPNTLMLRGSIGASYLHPLQCILPAEEFGAARSSKDFALAIKTLSAKWSFLVFNLHLPHGDEYGCTKKKKLSNFHWSVLRGKVPEYQDGRPSQEMCPFCHLTSSELYHILLLASWAPTAAVQTGPLSIFSYQISLIINYSGYLLGYYQGMGKEARSNKIYYWSAFQCSSLTVTDMTQLT